MANEEINFDEENADGLYKVIYDWLEINPMPVSMLLLVFEQIKYEQIKDMIEDGE